MSGLARGRAGFVSLMTMGIGAVGMRKVDPSGVRTDFAAGVDSLMGYLRRTGSALEGAAYEKSDISRLAAMVFMDMYVGFERFLSDLFLAYLNRDFSRYQKHLEQRLRQSAEQKIGVWAGPRIRFDAVKHVRVDDLESIVDPDGRNLTFKNAEAILQRACDWLAPSHRKRITSMSDHDQRLIDTAHAVRDFIVHQSPDSKDRMNELLASVARGNHNEHLGRGAHRVHNVGAYLKAIFDGSRRIALYGERLKEISAKM